MSLIHVAGDLLPPRNGSEPLIGGTDGDRMSRTICCRSPPAPVNGRSCSSQACLSATRYIQHSRTSGLAKCSHSIWILVNGSVWQRTPMSVSKQHTKTSGRILTGSMVVLIGWLIDCLLLLAAWRLSLALPLSNYWTLLCPMGETCELWTLNWTTTTTT